MLYASNGGFTWSDLYTMPTYLREFYWNELLAAKETENQAYKSASRKSTSAPKSIARRR